MSAPWFAIEEMAAATRARLLAAPAPRAAIAGVSIDSRTVKPGEVFFAIKGPRFDGHDFLSEAAARGAAAVVVHRESAAPPGLGLLLVADTTLALADLARAARLRADVPVVAITGSTGKTTTKEMASALLARRGPVLKTEGNFNNQYGLPLTLLRLRDEHKTAVLELGMSAAGETRLLSGIARPDVAVWTNVGPAHLEFFDSVDDIARAKAEIFEGLREGGRAVLNGDDPRVRREGERWGGRAIWFGRDRRYEVSAESVRGTAFGMRFDLRVEGRTVDVALPFAGHHFVADFLAAAGAAWALGVEPEAMAEEATQLVPSAHRGQMRRLGQGVTLLDDCYNSSPDALEAALVALGMAGGRRRAAFLGDMLELGPVGPELHRRLGRRLAERVELLVGVGELARHFLEGAREAGLKDAALHAFPDSAAAAEAAPALVAPGDAVLVKGSRAVRMERVVNALVAKLGEARG